ncbi:hypothetical protein VTI28DRAFT_9236 [Corynascus sepedonium]
MNSHSHEKFDDVHGSWIVKAANWTAVSAEVAGFDFHASAIMTFAAGFFSLFGSNNPTIAGSGTAISGATSVHRLSDAGKLHAGRSSPGGLCDGQTGKTRQLRHDVYTCTRSPRRHPVFLRDKWLFSAAIYVGDRMAGRSTGLTQTIFFIVAAYRAVVGERDPLSRSGNRRMLSTPSC